MIHKRGKSEPQIYKDGVLASESMTHAKFFKALLNLGFCRGAPKKEVYSLTIFETLKVDFNLFKAAFNLLHTSSLPFLCVIFLYISLKAQNSRARITLTLVLFYHLVRFKDDDNCRQALISPDNKLLGLHCKSGGTIFKIVKLMHKSLEYSPTPWLFSGHFQSIYCGGFFKRHQLTYYRNYYSFGEELIPLSWCLQSEVDPRSVLVVCFPGIGGDIESNYVRSLATHLTEDNDYSCVIPNVLGFRDSTAEKVERIFQYDSNECMLSLLHQISQVWAGPIFLLGWSMGAVWVTAIMNKYKDRLPAQVTGGIAFSGAFHNNFTLHPYYRNTYQPLICTSLAMDFVKKYRPDLEPEHIQSLLSAANYEELFSVFAEISGVPFEEFLDRTSSEPTANKPLLVLSALDDPLHNPNNLGLEKLEHTENENVGFVMTRSGGHVGWPEGWIPKDFTWMRNVTSQFIERTLEVLEFLPEEPLSIQDNHSRIVEEND